MKTLLHPTYLPSIVQFGVMFQSETIVFEAFDNFQKQTYRNRTYIYAANGKVQLNIPVRHSQNIKQFYTDVEIAYDYNWRLNHKRTIDAAYSRSPFYEFYRDDILPLYDEKTKFLYDFNLKSTEVLLECLQRSLAYERTRSFQKEPEYGKDFRYLVDAKSKNAVALTEYVQVFASKHGFINNLSALDLICNLGPESALYLDQISLV